MYHALTAVRTIPAANVPRAANTKNWHILICILYFRYFLPGKLKNRFPMIYIQNCGK